MGGGDEEGVGPVEEEEFDDLGGGVSLILVLEIFSLSKHQISC